METKTLHTVLIGCILLVTIALTVVVGRQQQDLRQRASGPTMTEPLPTLPPTSERETGKLIVKYKDDAKAQEVRSESIPAKTPVRVDNKIEKLETEVVVVQPGKEAETIQSLEKNPNVAYVEPDIVFSADYIPNDPEWSKQYNLPLIQAPQAWDTTRGNNIKIAVLDSGIDLDHPDLASQIMVSKNFTTSSSVTDYQGHGTHVAGIIASITGNGVGTAGTCPECKLLNVKVLGDDGRGTCSGIAEGIIWAADNGAKVITMSLGSSNTCQTYENALNYAYNKGAVLVATAGNTGDETPRYPAYYDNVIAVAATDSKDAKVTSSSYGSWVDFAAPGGSIYSTIPDSYGYKTGTSMAAPHVAAIAGLLFSHSPGITNAKVRSILEKSADSILGTGSYWQFGRVNAARALSLVPTITPSPIVTLTPTPSSSTATKVQLSIFLHGIGKSGDNANPQSMGNPSPKTTTRTFMVEIFNADDQRVLQKSLSLAYSATQGNFSGTLDLGNTIPSGSYTIKISSPTYLRKTLPGIQTITAGSTLTLPSVSLVAGDANKDNRLDIRDYTLIMGCYSDLSPAKDCDGPRADVTDLTDDGKVNQIDYNLFLRELSLQSGD